jgi:hypothetical protein
MAEKLAPLVAPTKNTIRASGKLTCPIIKIICNSDILSYLKPDDAAK